MLQLLGAVAPLAKTLLGTIDKAVPDKDLAQKIKAEFNNELLNGYSNLATCFDVVSDYNCI